MTTLSRCNLTNPGCSVPAFETSQVQYGGRLSFGMAFCCDPTRLICREYEPSQPIGALDILSWVPLGRGNFPLYRAKGRNLEQEALD
jgi:hypothetical protein